MRSGMDAVFGDDVEMLRALDFIKKRWFLFALATVCAITLIDMSGATADLGKWCKARGGADAVIFFIFLASGLILKADQVRKGLGDVKGTAVTLTIVFVIAPVAACGIALLPLDPGVRIGLFLVAVMPTTLTSGMVMTGASGGNMAHALLITLIANSLAVLTVPLSLEVLLGLEGQVGATHIDKAEMMVQIALLVLVPLLIGLWFRPKNSRLAGLFRRVIPVFNQSMILAIVWMALSGAREAVIGAGAQTFHVVVLAFLFHAVLLAAAFTFLRVFRIGRGKRESVIFMGGQKTLPLSVLLQTTLFPQYGLALAFCVVHHFVHLMMDGYLVHRLGR